VRQALVRLYAVLVPALIVVPVLTAVQGVAQVLAAEQVLTAEQGVALALIVVQVFALAVNFVQLGGLSAAADGLLWTVVVYYHVIQPMPFLAGVHLMGYNAFHQPCS